VSWWMWMWQQQTNDNGLTAEGKKE